MTLWSKHSTLLGLLCLWQCLFWANDGFIFRSLQKAGVFQIKQILSFVFLYTTVRDAPLRQSCCFLTLFKTLLTNAPPPLDNVKKVQDWQSGASLTYSNIYVLILVARTLSKSPNISFASSTIAALTESAWKTCRTKSSALPLCHCCQDWSLNCEIVDRGGGSLQ